MLSDVKFLRLKVPDDGGGGETDAMDAEATVSGATQSIPPVLAGSLPTTTGKSTMGIPAVVGDQLDCRKCLWT